MLKSYTLNILKVQSESSKISNLGQIFIFTENCTPNCLLAKQAIKWTELPEVWKADKNSTSEISHQSVPNKAKHCIQAFCAERQKSQLQQSSGNQACVLHLKVENSKVSGECSSSWKMIIIHHHDVSDFRRHSVWSLLQSLAVRSPS